MAETVCMDVSSLSVYAERHSHQVQRNQDFCGHHTGTATKRPVSKTEDRIIAKKSAEKELTRSGALARYRKLLTYFELYPNVRLIVVAHLYGKHTKSINGWNRFAGSIRSDAIQARNTVKAERRANCRRLRTRESAKRTAEKTRFIRRIGNRPFTTPVLFLLLNVINSNTNEQIIERTIRIIKYMSNKRSKNYCYMEFRLL